MPKIKIYKIEFPEGQKILDLKLESRSVRFDIYIKGDNNTVYNVEMQRSDNLNLHKRTRYYKSIIDIDTLSKGTDYTNLPKSYIIFICTFDMFKKGFHILFKE